MMDQLVKAYPQQLEEAIEIGQNAVITAHNHTITKAIVAGMGGSGIGATIVSELIQSECPIPYNTCKGYEIPNYIDKNTLAIISSFSGNTEETLITFEEILKRGAKIVCVSSGGKLLKRAKELGLDYVQLPGDSPSPRACVGYSYVQQLFILHKLDLFSGSFVGDIQKSIALLNTEQENIKKEAKQIADILYNKLPIIYATEGYEGIAVRFRQQLNENGKMLCWHHVIPEMNHNELVGWRTKNDDFAVVYFRDPAALKRNQVRIEINKSIIKKYTPHIIEIESKGSSMIEKTNYFIHLGDWVSVYVSEKRNMDPIEIDVIDYLKSELSKV